MLSSRAPFRPADLSSSGALLRCPQTPWRWRYVMYAFSIACRRVHEYVVAAQGRWHHVGGNSGGSSGENGAPTSSWRPLPSPPTWRRRIALRTWPPGRGWSVRMSKAIEDGTSPYVRAPNPCPRAQLMHDEKVSRECLVLLIDVFVAASLYMIFSAPHRVFMMGMRRESVESLQIS